jgi:two-component sensor histidine kinase
LRLYAPGERERVEAETLATLQRGETSIRFEARHLWPDGVVKWISVRAQIILEADGTPSRVLGVAMDVTDRRQSEERLKVTARELQHRVKNMLAVVQSIAGQSFRTAATTEQGLVAFTGRLKALAAATDLMTRGNWETVPVGDVVEEILKPYRDDQNDRFAIIGERAPIDARDAVSLGMALHELATNAVKYGALSRDSGRVSVRWAKTEGRLVLDWSESGGPPVIPPDATGFGTRLLRRGLFEATAGRVELEFRPEGVACRIVLRAAA